MKVIFLYIIKKNMDTKKCFKRVVCALALGIVGFSFSPVSTFAASPDWNVFGDTSGNLGLCLGSSGSCGGDAPGGFSLSGNPYGLPEGSILGIIENLLFWLLAIFAVLGVIGFIISGIFYLVSAGDEGMADKGKDGMKYSILGIIVGLSGFLLLQAVELLLSGRSSTF